jgi:uncharacterized protein (TIGR00369 family)
LEEKLDLENVRLVLSQQPFSNLIQAYCHQINEGAVDLRVAIRDDLRQQQGFVHGGLISYLADNALTIAGGLALGPKVVTGEYKINYLRPAIDGILSARAYSVHKGSTQTICRCEIFLISEQGEKIVAIAQGTINLLQVKSDGLTS